MIHDRDLNRDGDLRLQGALIHATATNHIVTEALHTMQEAHTLIVNGYAGDAISVLEVGIAQARYALNLTP